MKEGKKKITAKKNMSSSKKSVQRQEPPKVKKVEVDEVNKDFEDVENEDRRLIVFIAIAILVIVGTIVGLLVGCEKRENEKPTPDKPNTDVVVPEKPDKKDENNGVKTKEIVRKVKATYTSKKSSGKKDNGSSKTTYEVTFYLGEESETETVDKDGTPSEYVPVGYENCSYFKDSELTEEYDIKTSIIENVNVYLKCDVIEYNVVYESSNSLASVLTTNPATFKVTDESVELSDPDIILNKLETEKEAAVDETAMVLYFGGWFTEYELTNRITALSKASLIDVLKSLGEEKTIHIYAKITDEEPTLEEDELLTSDEVLSDTMLLAKERIEEEVAEVDEMDEVVALDAEEETLEVLEPEEVEELLTEEEALEPEEEEVKETVSEEVVLEEKTEVEETVVPEEVIVEEEVVEVDEMDEVVALDAEEETLEVLEPEEVEVPEVNEVEEVKEEEIKEVLPKEEKEEIEVTIEPVVVPTLKVEATKKVEEEIEEVEKEAEAVTD